MKKLLAGLTIASILAFYFPKSLVEPVHASSLTSAADTLSTSRLSYQDALTSTVAQGTTLIPVTSTTNLFTNDSVLIGTGGTMGNPAGTPYTVDDIYSATQLQLVAGIDANDLTSGYAVIASRSATHTVTFTPASGITNGAFRILIPSGTNGNNDGIPNNDGFDFNGITAASLTAPTGGGVTSWAAATATASGGTGCAAGNHCFEARYNGTNSISALTFTIGGSTKLINPSPKAAGHTAGGADTYTVTIQHLGSMTSQYPVIDQTTVRIAVVESVRVTATVDPTITFTISGENSSTTRCNVSTDVTTTATAVPFGTMTLNTFKNAAQKLAIATNANGGYIITTVENDQLGKDGGTSPMIPDTTCDTGSCTQSSQQEWATATNNGFGYSLQDIDSSGIAFTYASSSGTWKARQFAATIESESPVQIMQNTSLPTTTEAAYICYRLSIGSTQVAGDYENNITYTATATF